MLAGKLAVVCGYGNVGKGSAASLRTKVPASWSPRSTRSAPCKRRWRAIRSRRWTRPPHKATSLSPTGNIDVITIDHMRHMKDRAIVCNIGHFDSEIQIEALRNYP